MSMKTVTVADCDAVVRAVHHWDVDGQGIAEQVRIGAMNTARSVARLIGADKRDVEHLTGEEQEYAKAWIAYGESKGLRLGSGIGDNGEPTFVWEEIVPVVADRALIIEKDGPDLLREYLLSIGEMPPSETSTNAAIALIQRYRNSDDVAAKENAKLQEQVASLNRQLSERLTGSAEGGTTPDGEQKPTEVEKPAGRQRQRPGAASAADSQSQ
jgi:hypothetical protein